VIIINKGTIVADDNLASLLTGSSGTLKITFKEPLEAAWLERLPAILAVNKIDVYNWQVNAADVSTARKQVMQLAIDHNLNIAAIQESGNLEAIFRSLTASY
jgi:ABC-2 type transport system ATP-binding protein